MKSYTDINQSKKLAEILPLESADMRYEYPSREREDIQKPMMGFSIASFNWFKGIDSFRIIPCWSLAALLSVIPYNITFNKAVYRFKLVKFSDHRECYHENFGSVSTEIFKADNPVDAAFEMVVWLKENEYKEK